MSDLTANEIRELARGETNSIDIDWGESTTAGQETGVLKATAVVSSCTVAVNTKPSGAADPTLGSVTVNSGALVVNGRSCSAGEATQCTITTASDAAYGEYVLLFTATTDTSLVIPRYIRLKVVPC